jgi:hypothetical protein
MAMRADNSAHLIAAAHRRSEHTLARARKALAETHRCRTARHHFRRCRPGWGLVWLAEQSIDKSVDAC